MEDHEAHVPADPFDLGAVSESVSRESAPQARVAEVRSRRTVKPDFTVVRVEPHHGSQPRYELYSTTVHKTHPDSRETHLQGAAVRKRGCMCTTRTSPVCSLSHMEHFSPNNAPDGCAWIQVYGSEYRASRPTTLRSRRGWWPSSRRWASSTGPMRSGPSPSRQRQLDLRSLRGRRDLDLHRGLLVGRTRSTSI
jgi:hypothetical protein